MLAQWAPMTISSHSHSGSFFSPGGVLAPTPLKLPEIPGILTSRCSIRSQPLLLSSLPRRHYLRSSLPVSSLSLVQNNGAIIKNSICRLKKIRVACSLIDKVIFSSDYTRAPRAKPFSISVNLCQARLRFRLLSLAYVFMLVLF